MSRIISKINLRNRSNIIHPYKIIPFAKVFHNFYTDRIKQVPVNSTDDTDNKRVKPVRSPPRIDPNHCVTDRVVGVACHLSPLFGRHNGASPLKRAAGDRSSNRFSPRATCLVPESRRCNERKIDAHPFPEPLHFI